MDDAQFPPETGDAKGTPARRVRTRLSDVETVAASRLDMFGDNSLKEALAGAPPASGESDVPSGAAQGDPVAHDARPPAAGPGAGSEPATGDPDSAAFHATSADTSSGPPGVDRPFEHQPDPTGAAVPMRLEASSIFDALDEAERATEGHAEADAPPWWQAGPPGLDQPSGAEPDPVAAPMPARMEVASIFAALDDAERTAGVHAQADGASSAEPDPPGPDQSSGAELGPAAEPITARMEVSSVFAELIEAERQAGPEPDDEVADAGDAVPVSSVEHNGWPILPSDLADRARQEGDAVADDIAVDSVEAAAASAPAEQDPEALPAPEPVQAPSDPPPPSSLPDMSAGPPFPDPSGIMPSDALSHPPPFFRSELEPPPPAPQAPPPPPGDAAARIEAEANATAEALENLQRLLDDNHPSMNAPPPPARLEQPRERVVSSPPLVGGGLRMNVPPAPSPFIGGMTAPLLPLPVPPERSSSSSKGIYVLGFLAGLGLSLMAGAVLFLFISLG